MNIRPFSYTKKEVYAQQWGVKAESNIMYEIINEKKIIKISLFVSDIRGF